MAAALVGLHLLDAEAAAAEISEMIRHPVPGWRAALAAAMGQARDRRFVPLLNSLIKDPDAGVRGTVLKALVSIRKKPAEAAASPEQNLADRAAPSTNHGIERLQQITSPFSCHLRIDPASTLA